MRSSPQRASDTDSSPRAAEILGTTRRILKYKMDKLGIVDKDASEFS